MVETADHLMVWTHDWWLSASSARGRWLSIGHTAIYVFFRVWIYMSNKYVHNNHSPPQVVGYLGLSHERQHVELTQECSPPQIKSHCLLCWACTCQAKHKHYFLSADRWYKGLMLTGRWNLQVNMSVLTLIWGSAADLLAMHICIHCGTRSMSMRLLLWKEWMCGSFLHSFFSWLLNN